MVESVSINSENQLVFTVKLNDGTIMEYDSEHVYELPERYTITKEQWNTIKNELKENEYLKLPAINSVARILVLAKELVEFTDGNITMENIQIFLNAYQTKRVIEMREIWMFPIALKIALIDYIKKVSERIIVSQYQKLKLL